MRCCRSEAWDLFVLFFLPSIVDFGLFFFVVVFYISNFTPPPLLQAPSRHWNLKPVTDGRNVHRTSGRTNREKSPCSVGNYVVIYGQCGPLRWDPGWRYAQNFSVMLKLLGFFYSIKCHDTLVEISFLKLTGCDVGTFFLYFFFIIIIFFPHKIIQFNSLVEPNTFMFEGKAEPAQVYPGVIKVGGHGGKLFTRSGSEVTCPRSSEKTPIQKKVQKITFIHGGGGSYY